MPLPPCERSPRPAWPPLGASASQPRPNWRSDPEDNGHANFVAAFPPGRQILDLSVATDDLFGRLAFWPSKGASATTAAPAEFRGDVSALVSLTVDSGPSARGVRQARWTFRYGGPGVLRGPFTLVLDHRSRARRSRPTPRTIVADAAGTVGAGAVITFRVPLQSGRGGAVSGWRLLAGG